MVHIKCYRAHFKTLTLLTLSCIFGTQAMAAEGQQVSASIAIPCLQTNDQQTNRAFRIAVGDLVGNVGMHRSGLLDHHRQVILAGLDYGTPWTRDASVNAWNGASLIMPEIARDTLLSVLQRDQSKVRIGGQYWDAIVWATGAWHHYLCTGDTTFLSMAMDAVANSLTYFEQTEFDAQVGLFRGAGWSDGVAAYPGIYGAAGGSSAILDWPKHHPDMAAKPGYGIPMKALSTNCLYYNAYRVAQQMAKELGRPVDPTWNSKAVALKDAIDQRLWMEDKGWYRFFIGPNENCDDQEGLGNAYAILFGIADQEQTAAIFQNMHVTPAGLPCGWPTCPRYVSDDGQAFGRHSGPVWPQIQGFWAEAAARSGKTSILEHELKSLAGHAVRDNQFAEMYHPLTGEIYGGMQESEGKGIVLWDATSRQTWAATAFLRMVLYGVIGMQFEVDGIRFTPCLTQGITHLELSNLTYRGKKITIVVSGVGKHMTSMTINGTKADHGFLPNATAGPLRIEIQMGRS